jgi:hypothetical protein
MADRFRPDAALLPLLPPEERALYGHPQIKPGTPVRISLSDGDGGWTVIGELKPSANPIRIKGERHCCGRLRSEAGSPYLAFKCADCPL